MSLLEADELGNRIEREQVAQLKTSVEALKRGEVLKLHGWTVWRTREVASVNGVLEPVECIWLEDRQGRYAMLKGVTVENIRRMWEMFEESKERDARQKAEQVVVNCMKG